LVRGNKAFNTDLSVGFNRKKESDMTTLNIHQKYFKCFLTCFCFLLAILVGVIRYLTGPEFALSLFYLFPIILVTWYVGKWTGILLSLVSAVSWLMADLAMRHAFSSSLIPFLNETFRLVVFLIITFILLKLKKAIDTHKALARTDSLTLVHNRRAFHDLADLEITKARRSKKPISVLYVDIDNFKQINDHFGHRTGDTLLCSVAKTIKTNIRAIDIMARLGGDEFCILLAETGSGAVALVARKLKEKLMGRMQNDNWPVTFSIGVVTFENPPVSVDQLITAADSQMYFAKSQGKNRIHYKVVAENEDLGRTWPRMSSASL
jgi:diguanylate cyclase (GGDEF)-like protein